MSIGENIRSKQIKEFFELPPLFRLLTGVGVSQIITGILVIGLKQIPLPVITVAYFNNSPVTLSVLLAFIIYFLNIIAWSYILLGVIHSNAIMRLIFLGLFTYFMVFNVPNLIVSAAVSPIVLFVWIYIFKRQKRKDIQVNFKDLLVILVSVLVIHIFNVTGAYVRASAPNGGLYYIEIAFLKVSSQIVITYLPLIPLLLIAGLDLVEFNINTCSVITDKTFGFLKGKRIYITAGLLSLISCGILVYFFGIKASFITSFILMAVLILIVYFLYRDRDSEELSFNFMLFITITALAFLLVYALVETLIKGQAPELDGILAWSSTLASALWFILGVVKIFIKKDYSKKTVMLLIFSLWYFASIGIGAVTNLLGITVNLTANIQYVMLSGLIILTCCCVFSIVKREINREFILRLVSFNMVAFLTYLVFMLFDSGVDLDIGALYALTQSTLFLALPTVYIIKNAWGNKAFRFVVYTLFAVVLLFGVSIIFFPETRWAIIQFMQLFLVSTALLWETMQFGDRFKESKANKNKYYSNLSLYFGYVIFLIMGLIYHDGINTSDFTFFNPDLIGQFSCAMFGLPIAFMFLVAPDSSEPENMDAA